MNLMGSWPPSILNVIHHIQTHMHFWKIPSCLALLKKLYTSERVFFTDTAIICRELYVSVELPFFYFKIGFFLSDSWEITYRFFFWPAAFDCMVIVMRCKIDESVICKTLLQWMDSHWRTLQLRIGHETASIKPSFISKHQSLCAAGHFWGQFNGLYHISPQTVTGRGNVMTKWLAHYYVNFHHQLPEEANKTVMSF